MSRTWRLPAALTTALAITTTASSPAPAAGAAVPAATTVPAAPAKPAAPPGGIVFIEDDYPRALTAARKTGVPLFVDAWAPWCHSCLSMRSYVFPDPALAPFQKRFIWLAIDTEKESNAAFVKAYPVDTWPTLLIIDAKTGTTRATWRGALKVDELKGWLNESLVDQPEKSMGGVSMNGVKERAAEARMVDLRRRKDNATCVSEGINSLRSMPATSAGTPRLNVAIEGLTCAQRLPATAPKRADQMAAFARELQAMVSNPNFVVLADDRSNGYAKLVEAAESVNDEARVKALATPWLAFLQTSARAARDPAARAVFDPHLVLAALALKRPEVAMPALEISARDFPNDYNPPARLARLYLSAGRVKDARVAIDRALALVYGPRRLRIEALEIEIAAAEKLAGKPTSAMK